MFLTHQGIFNPFKLLTKFFYDPKVILFLAQSYKFYAEFANIKWMMYLKICFILSRLLNKIDEKDDSVLIAMNILKSKLRGSLNGLLNSN